MAYDSSNYFGATHVRHAVCGQSQGFGLHTLIPKLSVWCAHVYRPESLGFLDYMARLAGLYMASCDSVSPQIPECEW